MTPGCPITAVQDALTLLRSGRAAMAQRILEGLPALIESALVRCEGVAYLRGQADAHRIIAAARERQQAAPRPAPAPSAPRKPTRLDWLGAALADPAKRERAPAAVGLDELLGRAAAGSVAMTPAHWRKLREVLA